eukprot:6925256-Prymnesium_polylepis.1
MAPPSKSPSWEGSGGAGLGAAASTSTASSKSHRRARLCSAFAGSGGKYTVVHAFKTAAPGRPTLILASTILDGERHSAKCKWSRTRSQALCQASSAPAAAASPAAASARAARAACACACGTPRGRRVPIPSRPLRRASTWPIPSCHVRNGAVQGEQKAGLGGMGCALHIEGLLIRSHVYGTSSSPRQSTTCAPSAALCIQGSIASSRSASSCEAGGSSSLVVDTPQIKAASRTRVRFPEPPGPTSRTDPRGARNDRHTATSWLRNVSVRTRSGMSLCEARQRRSHSAPPERIAATSSRSYALAGSDQSAK